MPAMCHCNMSKNYPFCDNTHKKIAPQGSISKEDAANFPKPEDAKQE